MRKAQPIAVAVAVAMLVVAGPLDAQRVRGTSMAGTSKPLTFIYNAICNNDEALVGLYGKAKDFVDRIGGYCVRVRANGDWDGEVRITDSFGGNGGTTFDRKCARGEAIAAFRGRAALYVDRLQIRCRPLSSQTSVAGTAYYKSAVGGIGGSAFGPYTCPNSKAAVGFTGQSGTFIDTFALWCRP